MKNNKNRFPAKFWKKDGEAVALLAIILITTVIIAVNLI